jgi:predicted metal-binding membrane protein
MIYDAKDTVRLRAGVFVMSALGWAAMVAFPESTCHCATRAAGASLGGTFASEPMGPAALGWFVMLVAMMAPMTLPALYHIRISSFASRRFRSSALFLLGYALVWMAAGAALKAAEITTRWYAAGSFLPAVAVALFALVWQVSPFKQQCLNRCHGHGVMASFGAAADRDALVMGLDHGRWCAGSCWALMLLPMLMPVGHLVTMAAVTVLMFCERLDPPRPPAWRMRGFGTARSWLRMRLFGPRISAPPWAEELPS